MSLVLQVPASRSFEVTLTGFGGKVKRQKCRACLCCRSRLFPNLAPARLMNEWASENTGLRLFHRPNGSLRMKCVRSCSDGK